MLCDPYEEPQPRKEQGVLGAVSGLLRVSYYAQCVLSWRWLACVMRAIRPLCILIPQHPFTRLSMACR